MHWKGCAVTLHLRSRLRHLRLQQMPVTRPPSIPERGTWPQQLVLLLGRPRRLSGHLSLLRWWFWVRCYGIERIQAAFSASYIRSICRQPLTRMQESVGWLTFVKQKKKKARKAQSRQADTHNNPRTTLMRSLSCAAGPVKCTFFVGQGALATQYT